MSKRIQKVIILGGGTAGWMSAALLRRVLPDTIDIELVESEQIGIVGVGEATIPPIQNVNTVLGLDEPEFLRATRATLKLAIRFDDWRVPGEGYFHTFGAPGRSQAFCHFHHFWNRARLAGHDSNLWDYDLNYLMCQAGRFAKLKADDPMWEVKYAYHFDAGLYGQYLRRYSEARGVVRTEGRVAEVAMHPQTGHVEALVLDDGRRVAGNFFVDCSGQRGVLIQGALGVGFDDWSHWLPCDRAMAVPSQAAEASTPYTRATAHDGGWQWRIPLQHRNGNGLVYSSRHLDDEQAAELLLANLDTPAISDPRPLRFRTGRARSQWHRNVLAVGLASGFLEPLESTSIHLIQSAVVRLLHRFPHDGIHAEAVNEYNRQSRREYEQIRDFIILHYHLNERDGDFWRDLRHMSVPERLTRKIELFRANGSLFQDDMDIFLEPSWLQVMLGQGVVPGDYHPIADGLDEAQLLEKLTSMRRLKGEPVAKMPPHDEFLKMYGALAGD
ncbi:tryptophan 7-halogenase [Marinihelvus fidelis]|uniref:Tryptophan 7-halogenase n=1 Tax=Marinihelvus fidelis TaxID=2613842 RepID=A0A5N0TGB3_9GAMM|nr:tryptophan halogenase family protein [Marinihelvus fidelis]KAA9133514.1 tryptophan 7-halogenase [Marinihelvus fidelis]